MNLRTLLLRDNNIFGGYRFSEEKLLILHEDG